ncbi:MAG: phosphoenolpyruvate--protein phosphotransferase [Alphaproteobacteria bacterium]|jgi:phosphotransferase system enzyme I (PtsI)|nr:MAG: phosphoenolpyruvate--protein phosphotransferase [Alphaproteobacteria bacterium]
MPAEQIFKGQIASPGLALGTIDLHILNLANPGAAGTPEQERRALRGAVEVARAQLMSLTEKSDAMAGDILALQIALLEDSELTAPAIEAIEGGKSAAAAWREALDAQIEIYRSDDSEYFRARAADLMDLRDRVVGLFCGEVRGSKMKAPDAIYVAQDLAPSRFLETDWSRYRGAALMGGSASSHVAILARARGMPLLIGIRGTEAALRDGAEAILDAEDGRLIVDPEASTVARYRDRLAQRREEAEKEVTFLDGPAVTAGGARIQVCINVDDPEVLDRMNPDHCDGIGLTRSEFLFYANDGLPDEDRQFDAYARLIDWAGGKTVTIRTLDAGGDKPISGLTPEGETNPFLGLRGLRLSLARAEIFRVQLRALARAAARGPLKVMFPMVTVPAEMDQARALFEEEVAGLTEAGIEARTPPLGMMVEVPAAALDVAHFKADFFSIGSNDLVQYVTATGRDNAAVAALHDALNPAVLELIGRVAAHGVRVGCEVSLCGDMAAEPASLARLLDAGLRAVSVAPAALARTKAAIARSSAAGDGTDDG